MMYIIGAFLRLVYRDNVPAENIAVRVLVKQYGFTNNFSKTAELKHALVNMKVWIDRERVRTKQSPSPERMLNFIKVHMK